MNADQTIRRLHRLRRFRSGADLNLKAKESLPFVTHLQLPDHIQPLKNLCNLLNLWMISIRLATQITDPLAVARFVFISVNLRLIFVSRGKNAGASTQTIG